MTYSNHRYGFNTGKGFLKLSHGTKIAALGNFHNVILESYHMVGCLRKEILMT